MSGVLLDTAIHIAHVSVRRARNLRDHDEAMTFLMDLIAQREPVRVCTSRDNQIQDLMHEALDAQRVHGGQSLEQFLGGQR